MFVDRLDHRFAVAGEKPGDEAKKERERLQGAWKVVSTEFDGNTNNKPAEGDKVVVKGDKIVLTFDGKDQELTFTVAPGKDTKQIDLTPKGGPAGYYLQGIYKLEKDELVVCYALPIKAENVGKRQPTEFKTGPQSFTQIITLKRVKSE